MVGDTVRDGDGDGAEDGNHKVAHMERWQLWGRREEAMVLRMWSL